jgi:hypothetical protein
VDKTLFVALIVVLLPVGVVWAMVKSASLRGPAAPAPERRRPVGSLVTEAIPEEPPDDDHEVEVEVVDPRGGPPPRIPPAA